MSNKRLKIFAFFCVFAAAICILRLAYIQLDPHSSWQNQLEKIRTNKSTELASLRGRILDRNGNVLAADDAGFMLCLDYRFARLADERFWKVQAIRCSDDSEREKIKAKFQEDYNNLNEIIAKCAEFKHCTTEQISSQINRQINNPMWELRFYLAGKRKNPQQKFSAAEPDENKRLLLASNVDIAEMHQPQPLFKLADDDEVLAAQLKFIDTAGVTIRPQTQRYYPYGNLACQLIGWVKPWAPAEQDDSNDYSPGDVTGFCGIEYVCEPYLRGKAGRIVYDIDNEIVSRKERRFGGDVRLTIDIELQKKIENLRQNPNLNPTFGKAVGMVVIDVNSTDILAMASVPDFNLNNARWDYSELLANKNRPLLNRVLNETYPPGSSAKPIILAMGLEEKKVTPSEIISCPSAAAPRGWPNCWRFRGSGLGHDEQREGGNNARNALKGSCNIYFSHLAVRIEPSAMQEWLYNFGFGRDALETKISDRSFVQSAGIISSGTLKEGSLLPIEPAERRFFGIGQGNFRATPLQVANAFAALARGGILKKSRIIATDQTDTGRNLNLSQETIATIYDGMYAVVNEPQGTANLQFSDAGFEEKGIKVYGKTGSTERPCHAWFAGFAKDNYGKTIAFAVVVEGGQHGSSDAGPIAREIVSHCIESGYLQ